MTLPFYAHCDAPDILAHPAAFALASPDAFAPSPGACRRGSNVAPLYQSWNVAELECEVQREPALRTPALFPWSEPFDAPRVFVAPHHRAVRPWTKVPVTVTPPHRENRLVETEEKTALLHVSDPE